VPLMIDAKSLTIDVMPLRIDEVSLTIDAK
jgi:hypothetical protein